MKEQGSGREREGGKLRKGRVERSEREGEGG